MSLRCRPLPDPDTMLRNYVDFITGNQLCRRALANPQPASLANFLRDLLDQIYQLQQSCHLPEFTDHGLSHLCSLVQRISEWSLPPSPAGETFLVEQLTSNEAGILLLATLFHDVGMLSQRPEDLPSEDRLAAIPRVDDVATWVRRTHVTRMRGLVSRLFHETEHESLLEDQVIQRAFLVAAAHQQWPGEWARIGLTGRDAGLAAVLAISDLLDEDSVRCDTSVLVAHRQGNAMNYAHWLRHSLTVEVKFVDGSVRVQFGRLPNTDESLSPIYAALRNHFRLGILYRDELAQIAVTLGSPHFVPDAGIPAVSAIVNEGWQSIRGFGTQSALAFHLLRSFMPEALIDDRVLQSARIAELRHLGFEHVDMTAFRELPGNIESRSEDEQVFRALLLTKTTA